MPQPPSAGQAPVAARLPPWLKVRFPAGDTYMRLKRLMRDNSLHTVCEEARCPNIGECWNAGTATFMVLGDVCTRSCAFCAVRKGRPQGMDWREPERVAAAVKLLDLRYCVITSVNRDDQPDGGAGIFARCIQLIREQSPGCKVEVLTPDFLGDCDAIETVARARPDVFSHNTETVPRLYRRIRPKATYERSLAFIAQVRASDPSIVTKSGVMAGLGETWDELLQTMRDIQRAGCDILTIGQYLRPSPWHAAVVRFYTPEEFKELARLGMTMGYRHVEAGPLVRSSYLAERQVESMVAARA
ncbi:MAG: lipoyl synthase [Dehalococcoidia bacterium]|nr:lipoyl synthase [Dehalococcoidia bacterium]